MWPFRRRRPPRIPLVRLEDFADPGADYPVLSVGQSRLQESFANLDFTAASEPRHTWAAIRPVIDPRMNAIADVTISVEGVTVGYLRPPDLDRAIALLDEHNAQALEVPGLLTWSPAGPEVSVRLEPPAMLDQ